MSQSQITKGYSFPRTKCALHSRELAFFAAWDAYCEQNKGFPKHFTKGDGITRKESKCVAGVFQWLGTNVGFCFLEDMLRKSGYKVSSNKGVPKPLPSDFSEIWIFILEVLNARSCRTAHVNREPVLTTQAITNEIRKDHDKLSAAKIKAALLTMEEHDLVECVKQGRKNLWATTQIGERILLNLSSYYYCPDAQTFGRKPYAKLLEI